MKIKLFMLVYCNVEIIMIPSNAMFSRNNIATQLLIMCLTTITY